MNYPSYSQVYYQCDDPYMVTTLGKQAPVSVTTLVFVCLTSRLIMKMI